VAQAGQEKLAAKMVETSAELTKTRTQLDTTMGALNGLVGQKEGDLKPAYAAYCSDVARTQTAAMWTRQCAENMAAQGVQYFAEWQQELNLGTAAGELEKMSAELQPQAK